MNARRFTIADGLALVAATAVGFTLPRWFMAGFAPAPSPGNRLMYWVWDGPISCVIVAWAAALIVLSRPVSRRRLRSLARRPGFVACGAILAAFPVGVLPNLVAIGLRRDAPGSSSWYGTSWYWGNAVQTMPAMVLGAWMALALGRFWRSEPVWVDRAGRALGIYWIASYVVTVLHPVFYYLAPNYF